MERPASLREPMDMPDPYFPIKLNRCSFTGNGIGLFPHHWHEHLELLYFMEGEAVIECNSIPFQVREGDLILLNSNDLHYGVSQSDSVRYYALIADLALLQSRSPDAVETKFITPITQNRILFRNRIEGEPKLHACMDAIVQEFTDQQVGYELSIKSYMYRLLTLLLRSHVEETLPMSDHMTRVKNLQRFTPILHYIEEHYSEELTVEGLSRMAGLSRYHFSRLFNQLTNQTLTEYINRVRINKSEMLLRLTEMTISEVAMASGYNDISYFSRTFKRYKQMSPSELRAGITV